MARPNTVEIQTPLVLSAAPPQRVVQVESALRQLENGAFSGAALLGDAMQRDDRIAGCLDTRINGLLGMKLSMVPGKDTPRARKIAETLQDEWSLMFDVSALSELMRWGVLLNAVPTETVWRRDGGSWEVEKLKVWHPYSLQFDTVTRTYYVNDNSGTLIPLTLNDGKWGLYTPAGSDRPWMGGLIRSLAYPYLRRQFIYRDWSRKSEVNGTPMVVLKHPNSTNSTTLRTIQGNIGRRGSETTITLPQSVDPGSSYEIDLVEANSNGYEVFQQLLGETDSSIAIRLLGQSMSTEGQGGLGSQENGGDSVRIDIKRADNQRLSDFLRNAVLRPWALYNYGDADLAPWPNWEVEAPEDKESAANALKNFADGLSVLDAMKLPIDIRALLEEQGLPLITDAENDANRAKQAQVAMQTAADNAAAVQTAVNTNPNRGSDTPDTLPENSVASGGAK